MAVRDGPLLEMRGISKAFAGVPAIADGQFSIGRGEVHALIGQNGAGKSTLIKILNGAYTRDAGEIYLDGSPVSFASPYHAQQCGVSTIFQEINLVGYRSVTENIVLGQEPRRWGMIDWRTAHARAERAVSRFGLDIEVRRPLASYNIAVQQLIAIARAVSFDAKLVIMDEPTSSLDDNETEVLFSVIRDLQDSGVSILYITHHLDELFKICGRVTVMRDGRTIARRPIPKVTKLDLVALMIGRDAAEIEREGATGFGKRARPNGKVVLQVENIASGTGLRDASLILHEGEILGLAGLLGSGRSEIARVLFGLDPAMRGTTRFRERPATFASPQEAIRNGFGFCTEDRKADGIVPELSVRENATLALIPKLARRGVIPRNREREIVRQFIDRLKIKAASQDQPIRELSGGNQQKVLLARWMAVDPQLLILDEPTRGIDVGAKKEIQALIFGLAQRGVSILMISSEFEELIEGADRVIVLQDGRTVLELGHDQLDENALLRAVAHEKAMETI